MAGKRILSVTFFHFQTKCYKTEIKQTFQKKSAPDFKSFDIRERFGIRRVEEAAGFGTVERPL